MFDFVSMFVIYISIENVHLKKIMPSRRKSKGATHDACYRKAKAKFKIYPSARANQYVAKCRKSKGIVHKTKKGQSLRNWQKQKWKDTNTGKPCGSDKIKNKSQYCRPTKHAGKTPKMIKGKKLKSKQREKRRVGMGHRVSNVK